MTRLIHLHAKDNVAIASTPLDKGTRIHTYQLVCRSFIPAGHKVAIHDMSKDDPVYKYGDIIGYALQSIQKGDHVHSHNLYVKKTSLEHPCESLVDSAPFKSKSPTSFFKGYVRPDGKVGTRNYFGILSTVNCSASICHFIADQANQVFKENPDAFDGFVGLGHGAGCCMTIGGEGLAILQKTMAGFIRHPNFGGILVVGLGCEVNRITDFFNAMNMNQSPLLRTLDIQDCGGTENTMTRAMALIQEMMPRVTAEKREPVSAEHLILGLECGGSDAYSGISANPSLGAAADLLVHDGGTVILSETPEIYGAEHLLVRRAINCGVADKLIEKIKWWEAYTKKNGAEINNNPTPGNKDGGISTILEKSLGAVAKGGNTPLQEVYSYAAPVLSKGLVFMDTPGYDIVSITGMIAGGANLIGFTSGRGTVVGFKPVPCVKLASNTDMYHRMKGDMDINCGPVIDAGVSVKEMGLSIYNTLLETASGSKTKSEIFGYGNHEFVPWHIGAVL